jgi:hypothetical protein
MSYALDVGEEPGKGLARVIRGQHDKLLAACASPSVSQEQFVHQARVRCKKIRAALRLARPLMKDKDYRQENRWWRDAARGLSHLRDMAARMEALDSLKDFLGHEADLAAVLRLEATFARERAAHARGEDDGSVAAFRDKVTRRERFSDARIRGGDIDDLTAGLGEAYVSARSAMKDALDDPTAERVHEWRKQAKYHGLQMRLARRIFPDTLTPLIGETRDLAELLGHKQDIEVIVQAMSGNGEASIREALDSKRRELLIEAKLLGEQLFGPKRKQWAGEIIVKPQTADA